MIAKAGKAVPDIDTKAIQRQLLELGEIPNIWRGWGQLYQREKEGLFKNIQVY